MKQIRDPFPIVFQRIIKLLGQSNAIFCAIFKHFDNGPWIWCGTEKCAQQLFSIVLQTPCDKR